MKFDHRFLGGSEALPQALLTFHPEAERFPLMGNKEFEQLVEDIKANGLQNPIHLYEEKILDGRNRYLACREAGVEPKFVTFEGKDPVAFVYSENAHRRHLTRKQKLGQVAKLLEEFPERSDRQIGDLAQVHHKTVGRVREDLKTRGALRHVEKRVDSKGRSYTAHKEKKRRVAEISLMEPDDEEPASWVLACAASLRRGEINRNVNAILDILDVEKKQIAALPKASRAALARRFHSTVRYHARGPAADRRYARHRRLVRPWRSSGGGR